MIEKNCATCKWNRGMCLAPNSEFCSRTVIDNNVCDEYVCKHQAWVQQLKGIKK